MNFRFGFWIGLVAGLFLAFLWTSEDSLEEEIPVPVHEVALS